MASVDDRIVRMEFDNASFERKLQTTLASIGQLNKALKFEGASQGLSDVNTAASKVSFAGMSQGIEGVSKGFIALSTIAITTLATITTKALQAGAQLVKSFAIKPVLDGFQEYETNMNSIQTILANTASKGTTLDQVTAALDKLNVYSDKTIYNFGQMAKNIGTFTAAGVDLDTSVNSIKGIANLAAMSGSSADQASTAMYQLSQAIASGSLKLMDWNSVVNAGMGGEAFKSALFETGKAMKTLKDVPMGQTFKQWSDAGNSFRDSLHDGWITSDVLTTTLSAFTGDMTEEMLLQKGFNQDQATSIMKTAKIAQAAATEVKTFSQLVGTVKEAVGTGWADSFRIVIGNFTEAKELWTNVNNSIGAFVNKSADARNNLLSVWKIMGGRALLIDSMKEALGNLGDILKPIKDAFRDIFPPMTGQRLFELTQLFQKLALALQPTQQTVENLRSIFRGLFGVLEIGWTILKETAKFIAELFTSLGGGSGAFLETAGTIGDFLTKLNEVLVTGGGIRKFFDALAEVVQKPIAFINGLKDAIVDFFSAVGSNAPDVASSALGRLSDRAQTLKDIFDKLGGIWEPLGNALGKIVEILDQVWDVIHTWFQELGQKMADAISPGEFNNVLDALNVALLGGIAGLLAKFIKSGFKFDIGSGFLEKIGKSFEQLTGVMKAMQTKVKAEALIKIAIAIGILTASVLVLSMIDSVALTKALTAMAVGFGQLMATFAVLTKMTTGPKGAASFALLAGGLIILSSAILVLSFAVRSLATLSWDELTRGMTALTGMLILLSVFTPILSRNSGGMISAGIGITALSVSLLLLGAAMKIFASMSLPELAKGLITVAISLGMFALFMKLMPEKELLATGAGLILLATAMNIMAGAFMIFGNLSWTEIAKGMVALGGSLLIIAGVMKLMPDLVVTGAGLVLVGIGLIAIAEAMTKMGGMSWGEIAKGLVAMGASLLILAGAAYLMQGTIVGAVAIGVISASLLLLVAALTAFSALSYGDLIHGLIAIAAALAVIAIAAYAMQAAIPFIFSLGIALIALGAGFALIGVGAFLLAKALETIAKSGKAAAEAIPEILKAIGRAIPALFTGFAQGIVDLVQVFTDAAPVIAEAIGVLIDHLMDTIVKLIPKMVKVMDALIEAALKFLDEKAPEFIDAGLALLVHLLEGISDNIDHITDLVSEIIVTFLESLAEHIDEIVAAGLQLLSDFLNGIAENLHLVTEAMGNIVTSFIAAVANYYTQLLQAGVDFVVQLIAGIASAIWQIVEAGANMIIQLIVGIGQKALEILGAATWVIVQFIAGIGNTFQAILDAGVWVIVKLIEGIASAFTDIATAAGDAIGAFIDAIEVLILGDKKGNDGLLDKGVDLVLKIMEGVAASVEELATGAADIVIEFIKQMRIAIDDKGEELREQGRLLLGAIINGMTFGMAGKMKEVGDKFVEGVGGVISSGKKALRVIGDPYSLVTMGIAEAMVNGMTMALDADTSLETSTVDFVNRSAAVLENSLTKISESLGSIDEFNPTITPVLDLTQVAEDASKISDYIQSSDALSANLSYNQARLIASDTNAISSDQKSPVGVSEIKFEQNINAPTQLSTSDIYKQTRNQLSMAKEELSIP